MASIRAREETGTLFFDFRFSGVRCREQTTLDDTVENRANLQLVLDEIEIAIKRGNFNYEDFFPNSKNVQRFKKQGMDVAVPVKPGPLGVHSNNYWQQPISPRQNRTATRRLIMSNHYAYQAEAALAHFTHAQWTQHDGFHCERLSCVLYARAARCALNALLSAQGGNPDAGALNLLAAVACLDQRGRIFGRNLDKVQLHARQLSRALILDQSDAGAGYVTRDLFDQADVETCAAAATFFVDLCCRRLLRATYEQALVRFHPFRQPPMTDTTLWQRRHPSGRPGDKQSRRSS